MNDQTTHPESFEIEAERYELFEPGADFALDLDRRSFLRTLGGGLVILCLMSDADTAEAQQRGQRRGGGGPAGPREIEAWLHIGEDGSIEACSGKAEVGQNARTSLTQAVADELNVDVAAVRIVLGDTDKVPYDMGTFGSRTTPAMVPQLRRAAAAARSTLSKFAADRFNVSSDDLVVADGKIHHKASGRSVAFGELMKGRKLIQPIEADAPIKTPSSWKAAGTSVPKVNGLAFVTGTHQYSSDIQRPGMVRGKVLRPSAFDAQLVSVDVSKAEAMPGVKVIRDGDFIGVTAPEESLAARALAAIKAEWKTSPQPSDKDLPAYFKVGAAGEAPRIAPEAAAKLDVAYSIAYIAHAPLEPRAAAAEWSEGRLTVWTGTQRPFGVRSELARAFNIPEDRVRVIVPDTGSGYGGKHSGECAVEAARLAKGAGKPVKLVWTREEEFTWAYFRPGGLVEIKAGADKDGRLVSWDFHNYNSGGSGMESPYECPARSARFHQSKSPLRQGSYRALASTANHFARESAMDELAASLALDPLEFRLRNLKEPRLRAVLEAAADRFGWKNGPSAAGRGFGLACGTEKGGFVATCAEVESGGEGKPIKVIRLVTAFECGAIINPVHLKNQVEGCLVMGLGGLFESIKFADGKILNPRFSRYRVPRFGDLPKLDTILLDRKDLPSAGAGEAPIIAVAPAVANAAARAGAGRFRSLPLTPDGLKV